MMRFLKQSCGRVWRELPHIISIMKFLTFGKTVKISGLLTSLHSFMVKLTSLYGYLVSSFKYKESKIHV